MYILLSVHLPCSQKRSRARAYPHTSTCFTINSIQSKTPLSTFPRLPIDSIPPFLPSYRLSVDPIQREAIFKAMDQHVLTEGAGNRLQDLLKWHFKKQSSGIKCVSQSTLSLLQPGSSNRMAATAAIFKEASRLVEHDAGHSLMSELVRWYHLANFTGQFEQ